jgi:hypothetical protein
LIPVVLVIYVPSEGLITTLPLYEENVISPWKFGLHPDHDGVTPPVHQTVNGMIS